MLSGGCKSASTFRHWSAGVWLKKQKPAWLFGYPFSFCLANVGFLLGIVKALRNQKIVAY